MAEQLYGLTKPTAIRMKRLLAKEQVPGSHAATLLPKKVGSSSKVSAQIVWPPPGGIPAATISSLQGTVLVLGSALCQPSIFEQPSSTTNHVTADNAADPILVYNTVTSVVGANGPVQCKLGTIKRADSIEEIWMVDVEICTPENSGPNPNPPLSTIWDEDDDLSLGI